ncbi:iron-containing redox enzyme family protein [Engelhardtia mirabilis]|uniref:PqqC-like protein n=1 Tax=Engelhardtia mirabilis TaxID=2528011 RepID=A0A518BKC5_9BACT|nr:hypothetical protein Pla133_25010 [Planctomycetes bacterium Pla133]QDV01744.1 hypothetical protein Pla86_25000 [Planctomycetes bacterium Pla86]
MSDFLDTCERAAADGWARIKRGTFWRHVMEHGFDRELYVGLMTEIYHYTRENTQNQALAALDLHSDRLSLMRFCLNHALEEAGHDLMALNDLRSVGADPERAMASSPLPETQAFVAYLYRVASTRDATARLGYSLWAEGCYPHIAEVLQSMRSSLSLTDGQMTFFVAHGKIDEGHLEEVRRTIVQHCTTDELRAGVLDVLRTSLHLQGTVLEGVIRVHQESRRLEPAAAGR